MQLPLNYVSVQSVVISILLQFLSGSLWERQEIEDAVCIRSTRKKKYINTFLPHITAETFDFVVLTNIFYATS